MIHPMKCFEDFAVGDILLLGEKTVSREDIIGFATAFDPVPMHLDDAAARVALRMHHPAGGDEPLPEVLVPLDGVVSSVWHIGAMFMRTFYEGLLAGSSSRGSPGIETLDWPNPVHPGDTLRFTLEVLEIKASRSRPDLGLVLFAFLGVNQLGDPVMLGKSWTMFGRSEAAGAVV